MSWPRTYELNYVIAKSRIGLNAEELLRDIGESLTRDGYSHQRGHRSVHFRSSPDRDNTLWLFRQRGKVDVRCSIELDEQGQDYHLHFLANILKESLAAIAVMFGFLVFAILTISRATGGAPLAIAITFAIVAMTIFALVAYLSIRSALYDFAYYRIFWKYLNTPKT